VNVTPAFCSFAIPLTGSLSAIPNVFAAPFRSVPIATDMSVAAFVAWSNMSLPLPTSLRILVNVSSMFSPDAIASSSMPAYLEIEFARSSTCLALTFAADPVDAITAAVCPATFCASSASAIDDLKNDTTPAAPTSPAPTLASFLNDDPMVWELFCASPVTVRIAFTAGAGSPSMTNFREAELIAAAPPKSVCSSRRCRHRTSGNKPAADPTRSTVRSTARCGTGSTAAAPRGPSGR
jgi:hypothetical protein